MMQSELIFFHDDDDEILDAVRGAQSRLPKVMLSQTLVAEIRTVLGLAGPSDETVVLLRPEFRKTTPPPAHGLLAVSAAFTARAVLAIAFAITIGAFVQ